MNVYYTHTAMTNKDQGLGPTEILTKLVPTEARLHRIAKLSGVGVGGPSVTE